MYEDISKEISFKIKAFKCYKSEIEKFPHPRSIESIETLSSQRGMESGLIKAESFELIKALETKINYQYKFRVVFLVHHDIDFSNLHDHLLSTLDL